MTNDVGIDQRIVPIRRDMARNGYDDETRARAFVLFATVAARNARETERLLIEERADTELAIPHHSVISTWANEEHWHDQADDIWRNTKEWTHQQLQVIALANVLLGQQRRHDVLLGKLRGDNDLAAQYLKASELADKFVEKVLPIASMRPPEKAESIEDMTKEEREAKARENIVRKRQEAS